MSYHIVTIDSPRASISCRNGQLTCRTDDGEKKIPVEDVASIIITSFSAQIHANLFVEAAKHGVALIICESFRPVSLLLPANRSTDTLLTRAQISLPEKTRLKLWQMTIDAKCRNQSSLAAEIAPEHKSLPRLMAISHSCSSHKEAACARIFWGVFGDILKKDFLRERSRPGLNALLNYGYAVLLSTVLQKLFGVGIDPTFGISHVVRERSAPLAYDIMEPFRPCVDYRVAQWVLQLPPDAPIGVTKEFRKWITGFSLDRVDYLNLKLEVRGCIEGVARSLRRALMDANPKFYKPWIRNNTKWDG